jgi:PAS domain S-box-containing protein
MAKYQWSPTGIERHFGTEEVIVSKTDTKGRIIYANEVFLRIAGYTEAEIVGAPHSILRHPTMPRCVFKLLWDRIEGGSEIFAYVKNMCKGGDHYWVFAHITPSFDAAGKIASYHSNRRCPDRSQIEKVEPIYAELLEIENRAPDRKDGMEAAGTHLGKLVNAAGGSYDEFIFAV